MVRSVLPHQKAQSSEIIEQHQPCPNPKCGSSDAYCKYGDGHGYCFSCNTYTPSSSNDRSFELTNEFSYQFLAARGIDTSTMVYYDVKTKCDADGKPVSQGYQYPNGSYKIRTYPKNFHTTGDIAKAGCFGRNKFAAGSNKTITITEGELDALSLYQVIRSPCVSVRSSSSAVLDCTLDRSWINSFDRIYLAFDGDGPGRDAVAGVAKLFDFNKVFLVRFPGGDRKDANDYVRNGESDELRNIWNNSKKYLPESIISDLSTFRDLLFKVDKPGIPYPATWPTLNYMTYGIRLGESVLITAPTGVGKTEICRAIEHQILTHTDAAVAGIYIEEGKKRHIQGLAGLTLRQPVHLPDSGVDNERVFEAFREVVKEDDRLHLYSHYGSDDPDVILDTIRFLVSARACWYVILDHITMVVSGLGGKDATTALDYLSTRLEMMVKELNFSLIFVSHVNDEGLTRGSRNISNIADIQINLSRNVNSPDPVDRMTTRLHISKNRPMYRTGPAGNLILDEKTFTLNEEGLADVGLTSIRDQEMEAA